MIIKTPNTKKYNINNLPLFISLYYWQDNTLKSAHIRTRDFNGIQDAQIGDFGENWFCRPRKATKKLCYKSLKAYKIACSKSLKALKPDIVIDYFSIDTENKEDYNTYCELI